MYTGNETKFGMNKNTPKLKLTHSDRMINLFTVIIFILQLIFVCILGPIGVHSMWSTKKWYINNEPPSNAILKYIIIPLRFLLLNSSVIPISLKVTIDICKMIYTMMINKDDHMYVELMTWLEMLFSFAFQWLICSTAGSTPTDSKILQQQESKRPLLQVMSSRDIIQNNPEVVNTSEEPEEPEVHANSSSLSENLGQVRYIFTDKTGTLTKNEMILRYANVLNNQ